MTIAIDKRDIVPAQASLDDRGRLVHAEDIAAQLALSVTRLEAALAERGRTLAGLEDIEVRTTDRPALLGVLDLLTDRLAATGARPRLLVSEVDDLDRKGQLVAVAVTLSPLETREEGTDMTLTQPLDSPAAIAVRAACPEVVFLPGDAGYDIARLPWNLAVDQRPVAVAVPTSVAQVQAVVRTAAEQGLRVAPQSSGHGAAPLQGRLQESVLLRLTALTGVEVDTERRVARITGGTLWQDVVAAAAPYGLTVLHGSSPDVAVAGYTLGGGLSFYARQHGLAANSVVAVELVTATGKLVRASAEENTDLFWAVRGGGGNFGVVVAIELRLLPIADVVAGMLLWPLERSAEVLPAWLRWTREVPDSVTTSLRLMSFPPLPELPPFLSGRRIVVVDGAILEDDDPAAALLAPLRALAPELDTFARIPSAELIHVHMDPPAPTPNVSDHAVLGDLDDAAAEALLAQVGPGSTTSLLFAELRHLGGALERRLPDAGALACLPGRFALFCAAVAPAPEAAAVGTVDGKALVEAMGPWATGQQVLNFADNRVDTATAYDAEDLARLRAIKAAVDPDGLFQATHEVG